MRTTTICVLVLIFYFQNTIHAQRELSIKDFKPYTTYFKLTKDNEIPKKVRLILKAEFNKAQFVGLAEVHQSQQLSYFTAAALKLLSESCYDNFALEIGPKSAEILQELSSNSQNTSLRIKELNNLYGKNEFPKIPIVFVDKKEDASFIEEASNLEYKFWGLDQEYSYSFEMHLDNLYNMVENKTESLTKFYKESKRVIKDVIFKNSVNRISKNCWLKDNVILNQFFTELKASEKLNNYIIALKTSMEIYCKQETGNGGNQDRADYMKVNFKNLYQQASKTEKKPKVFLKLGSVHLTHSYSPFGVDDLGKYLHEKASSNNSEFLSIRHLNRYKNGKDLLENDEWKNASAILELGKKDRWTLIDLRPIRKLINNGELKTNEVLIYGINNYDYALISPDDAKGELNY